MVRLFICIDMVGNALVYSFDNLKLLSEKKKKNLVEIEFHPQDVERCINKFYINILFLRADEIDRLIFQEILME